MKPISCMLWECDRNEIAKLPKGFPIIEYDSLYSSIRLIRAGENKARADKRFVYLVHRVPSVEVAGTV